MHELQNYVYLFSMGYAQPPIRGSFNKSLEKDRKTNYFV